VPRRELRDEAAPGLQRAEVVGGEVEADAEGEGVEVEFARGKGHDERAGDYAADGEVADYAVVAGLLFEGEALFGWDGGLGGWCGHFGVGVFFRFDSECLGIFWSSADSCCDCGV